MVELESVPLTASYFLAALANDRGITPDSFNSDQLQTTAFAIRLQISDLPDGPIKTLYLDVANYIDELSSLGTKQLKFLEGIPLAH